jgi:hypothetical protein
LKLRIADVLILDFGLRIADFYGCVGGGFSSSICKNEGGEFSAFLSFTIIKEKGKSQYTFLCENLRRGLKPHGWVYPHEPPSGLVGLKSKSVVMLVGQHSRL